MSKVEEVARAIATAMGENWDAATDKDTLLGQYPAEMRDGARDLARAAIAAMREPSDAMLEVGIREPTHLYGVDGRDEEYTCQMKAAVASERFTLRMKWRDLVDAALQE